MEEVRMTSDEVKVRLMREEDIERILAVEQASFTTPWTRDAFTNEITKNHFAYYVVAQLNDEIVGYCGVWIIIDEAHITNIAVHPDYRGLKIGQSLMESIIGLAIVQGAVRMTLEVRESNTVAQSLYKKLGFVVTGKRKGYYTDNQEDALIMWANLKNVVNDTGSHKKGEFNESNTSKE